ncbi:MAG TPA: hypothetical protein VGF73_09070 [Chthoniobacterales bacterium]|jgi:hypothetical protein
MINILNRGFIQMSVNDFVALVLVIIDKLTANPDFPVTDPTLAAVSAQLGVLQAAMLIVDPVAREQAILAARAALEQMLDDLADNLEKTANLDPVKLATTGFPMHKAPEQTSEAPAIPTNARLRRTDLAGQSQLLCEAVNRAHGYEVQTSVAADGPYVPYDTFSSTRKMLLSGFEHGKDLWVRVRVIGPNNTKSGWSEPVRILVD